MSIAIVTGGSRGIGAATARLLGARGYRVCVNYQASAKSAAEVVSDIEASGGEAMAVQADVGRADDVARLFEAVDRELGTLSVLVNNAGIIGPRCRVDELTTADLTSMLDTNVTGVVLCSQEAVRRMSTQHGGGGGCIVNVSSGAAYLGSAGSGVHYALTKGAVNSFTIGLSQEVAGEGVRVNAVSPGLTRTDMVGDDADTKALAVIPMGRIGEPSEVAEAIAWLVSDYASFVAGANIRIAGGRP